MKHILATLTMMPALVLAQMPPIDRDLKAFYCLQVTNWAATSLQNGVAQMPEGPPTRSMIQAQAN